MPKAKWGAGDQALTASDINGAERQETQKRYSGELPRSGTYRFMIRSIKQAESNAGNPKAIITLILDGSWMKNHAQYDGCPLWDHLPIMDSTKERVANFLDAIGATGEDLLEKSIVDENGYITRMGDVGDPAGIMVYVNVKYNSGTKEYPNPKIEVGFNGYIPVEVDGDGDSDGAAGADDNGEEPPF